MASGLQSDHDDEDEQITTPEPKMKGVAVDYEDSVPKLFIKERKMKGVTANNHDSVPTLHIELIGDFNFYKRLGYCEPFLVLVDTSFLERYFLQEKNAVETIQNLLGGRFLFLLTNCVSRNFESKHPERLDVVEELYRCRDPVNCLRKDFECVKDVIKGDGIKDRLILATGNKELKRLMKKLSLVPIIYFNEPEVKDKVVARQLMLIAYDEKRRAKFAACDETANADLLKKGFFTIRPRKTTTNILVDEDFVRSGLQYYESLRHIVKQVSNILGRRAVFCTTRCAFKMPSPYISSSISDQIPRKEKKNFIRNFVICGHTDPRPASGDCMMSLAEKTEFGICFVATGCQGLKDDLQKMRFVKVFSIEGGEIILKNVVEKEGTSDKKTKRVKGKDIKLSYQTEVTAGAATEDLSGASSSSRKRKKRVKAVEEEHCGSSSKIESVVLKEELSGASSNSRKRNKQVKAVEEEHGGSSSKIESVVLKEELSGASSNSRKRNKQVKAVEEEHGGSSSKIESVVLKEELSGASSNSRKRNKQVKAVEEEHGGSSSKIESVVLKEEFSGASSNSRKRNKQVKAVEEEHGGSSSKIESVVLKEELSGASSNSRKRNKQVKAVEEEHGGSSSKIESVVLKEELSGASSNSRKRNKQVKAVEEEHGGSSSKIESVVLKEELSGASSNSRKRNKQPLSQSLIRSRAMLESKGL